MKNNEVINEVINDINESFEKNLKFLFQKTIWKVNAINGEFSALKKTFPILETNKAHRNELKKTFEKMKTEIESMSENISEQINKLNI